MVNSSQKKFFECILNGEQTRFEWSETEKFNQANELKPALFGKKAIDAGEAAFKAKITFKDGNIVGLRGDKYPNPTYLEMLRSIYTLSLKYVKAKTAYEIIIYDNRKLLPHNTKVILHWKEDKSTLINLLPIYSGSFDLKRKPNK